MRRREKPSFTVEIKRKSKSPSGPSRSANAEAGERHRPATKLASTSRLIRSAPLLKWTDLAVVSTPEVRQPIAEADRTEIPEKVESPVQPKTARVLPDLLSAEFEEQRVRREMEERAARRRRARRTRVGVQPPKLHADTRPDDDAEDEIRLDFDQTTSAAMADTTGDTGREVPDPALDQQAEAPRQSGPGIETTERQSIKKKRALMVASRRAKRRGEPLPLRAGERWKRRLPRVCW